MVQPLFLFLDGGESETQPTLLDMWRPVPQSTDSCRFQQVKPRAEILKRTAPTAGGLYLTTNGAS